MIRAMGSLVRLAAILASAIVALSLLLFALDQTSAGSENQVREIDAQTPAPTPPEAVEAPDPSPQAERVREQAHSKAREMIDDANDVLQNVFIRVWNGLENFKEESQLYTWLYRIGSNESLTFLESQKKRSAVSLSDVESGLSNKIKADKHFDPNRLEWKLQLAIQQLPEKQRIVFTLRYYDEMPYEQMSRVLETSEGALKASYHHAVKKIEDFIKNH